MADASDGTTLLKFRRLLEKHKLGAALFAQVNETLEARGLKVGTGTIVDATIIGAAGSTKNVEKARDPEMRQTRKRQQWYFGMKLHIGVDSRTGLTHSAVVTTANAHDKHALADLLRGEERRVYGDSAYASQKELIGGHAPQAKDFTNQRTRKGGEIDEAERSRNRNKPTSHLLSVALGLRRCPLTRSGEAIALISAALVVTNGWWASKVLDAGICL